MNNLILLMQTKSEATIEILSLLLIAGIIGFVTAWFYSKSIYAKRLVTIESDMDQLRTHITNLNNDKNNLQKRLQEKEHDTEYYMQEVDALRALHAEAVQETNDMKLKNAQTEQLLYEKGEALVHIAQRKQFLDYGSFGTATVKEKDDLRMISGIGPLIEERLYALDIYTFRQISKFTSHDIEVINDAIEYVSGRIERDEWVKQARELVSKDKRAELFKRIMERKVHIYYNRIGIGHKDIADDLTKISGIGGWIMEKLNALDIYTFRQIGNFTDEDVQLVTDAIEYFPGRIERDEWILQARELVRIAGKKSELLKRIMQRKNRIYYDRLGVAHKYLANNLTLINGISLWIEERLNMLDIYTFEQISKLTPEDVETITDILEIPPDRIDRDHWVDQARELTKTMFHQAA
jgi:predicted flap endonuclease-1-like 5' DNA nuclease